MSSLSKPTYNNSTHLISRVRQVDCHTMKKLLTSIQIGLGLAGLVVWAWFFATSCRPAQLQLLYLDRMADDATIQADLATEMIDRGDGLLEELEQSAALHRRVLLNAERPLSLANRSLEQWERDLLSYAELSQQASRIAARLSQQLPLQVPDVKVAMQDTSISIPELEVEEQTVRLPVPQVKTGTRSVNLDLGLTELKVDVPTLSVTTNEKVLIVPKAAQVGKRVERLRIPSSVDVSYRPLFAEEGQMLSDASKQLAKSSQNLRQSAETIDNARQLMNSELPEGLKQTQVAIEQAENALEHLRTQQLPRLRETLKRQRGELELSRGSLQQLSRGVPWLFAILGLLPLSVLLQGMIQWLGDPATSRQAAR